MLAEMLPSAPHTGQAGQAGQDGNWKRNAARGSWASNGLGLVWVSWASGELEGLGWAVGRLK